MSRSIESIDDVLLDRLVDGELCEAEYRQVLELLDARPEGWRRCALAFLESQALRRELRGGGEPLAARELPTLREPAWRSGMLGGMVGGMVALASAASFLLALYVANPAERPASVSPTATVSVTPSPAAAGVATTAAPGRDGRWGDYRLTVNGDDGQPQHIEMPIYEAEDPRARLLVSDEAGMPVQLIRALRQMGFQVDRQRQWAPVGQSAESPVIVPVEELRITPVSSRSYQ